MGNKTLLSLISICLVLICIVNYQQTKRLDAHKEVIELQQKQINQLIIHCEYERNK